MDSGSAGAYATHDAALDYFGDHTSAPLSWFGQYGPRKGLMDLRASTREANVGFGSN
jgi:hypothetical protein